MTPLTLRLALAVGAAHAAPAAHSADTAHDCLIEPNQRIEIRSPVTGVIDAVLVERGATVKAGQVLIKLDATVEVAALQSAQQRAGSDGDINVATARAEYARQKFKRSDELREQNFVSGQERDQSMAELRVAEAELALAHDNRRLAQLEVQRLQELVRQRSLRAPFAGVVTDRLQNPGELASTAEGARPILKLAQTQPLRVEVVLPMALLGQVKLGRTAEVLPEAPLKGGWRATVKVVDRVVDAASGSFGVRLELPNDKGDIPAGVKCRVKF